MAVASYLLAGHRSLGSSQFVRCVQLFNFAARACHSAVHSSFEPRLLFAKGELEGGRESSCKLHPATAPPFSQMNGYCCLRCAPASPIPPRRPSAILPLKPEFYSRNAGAALV